MTAASGRGMAADQLGGWRFGARGELRALPGLLRSDERVLGMALGSIGIWRGRLFVATDSRLLLVSKHTLRRARCTEVPYERIQVSHAAPGGGMRELRLVPSGERLTWDLMSGERGERFARLLAERSEAPGAEWKRSLGPLVAALDNRDGRIREDAVAGLGRLGDQRGSGPLLGALHDGDPFVRAAAVEALPRVLRRETTLPPLIEALDDNDQLVRARAAETLCELGARDAVGPLCALLRREQPGSLAQQGVATALERLGAGEARAERRNRLTSPLVLWIVGLALFGLGVGLASASGIGFGPAAAGLVGVLLLLGARLQAARSSGHGFFYLGGGEAVWLGASFGDGGGWADFGDGGGGDGGGDGGGF